MTKHLPSMWPRRLAEAFLDILFPPRCHACNSFIADAGAVHLCDRCMEEIPAISPPLCTICGLPFATEGGSDHHCSSCMSDPPPFSAARSACVYSGTIRDLVHGFKYQRKVQLRRPLGLLTAGRLDRFAAAAAADLVIPVPLHPRRLRERGFNQSVLLGEVMASRWSIPLCRGNLCRIRWTEPQTEISAAERPQNVRGAFGVRDSSRVEGKRIILVDDVYTTGATVRECSRTLRKAGATDVFVVTVARAVRD